MGEGSKPLGEVEYYVYLYKLRLRDYYICNGHELMHVEERPVSIVMRSEVHCIVLRVFFVVNVSAHIPKYRYKQSMSKIY